jgi:anti-sigma B factor antagonist
MLEITRGESGDLHLKGRFDASQAEAAKSVFLSLDRATTVDFAALDYISSAGLGILLAAQKNLRGKGAGLRLVNINGHILDVLRLSGFDQVFEIG